MIESVQFKNFKALRDTTLPLGRFTLIVGPNGSGKSTALQGLRAAHSLRSVDYERFVTVGDGVSGPEISLTWSGTHAGIVTQVTWDRSADRAPQHFQGASRINEPSSLTKKLVNLRVYSLDARRIAASVELAPRIVLDECGGKLAGVLDRLRDEEPERFERLNDELGRWLPEFDRVLFETLHKGHRAITLRVAGTEAKIPAQELSQGTLLALAMLTLAYIPDPPPFVGFEEPDRGIHPRLLRDVRDALYRLAYPENYGETRDPVQVVATTHSPYFVDLFSDHPEEIVVAEKIGQEARFVRLVDLPNVEEILQDSHLGEAWYSGILGGVPSER